MYIREEPDFYVRQMASSPPQTPIPELCCRQFTNQKTIPGYTDYAPSRHSIRYPGIPKILSACICRAQRHIMPDRSHNTMYQKGNLPDTSSMGFLLRLALLFLLVSLFLFLLLFSLPIVAFCRFGRVVIFSRHIAIDLPVRFGIEVVMDTVGKLCL